MASHNQPSAPGDATTLAPDDAFVHYYDQHPTEEDLMGESVAQSRLIFYLLQVLEWLYRAEGWFVVSDLNIYRRKQRYERPLVPDVALFKGVVLPERHWRGLRSWRMYEPDRPPPQVVFEICSDTTWRDDLFVKPVKYATLGVQEYFAYDPNEPLYFPRPGERLRGWRRVNTTLEELPLDAQGRLWSDELASYLVPDGAFLRLYDRAGQMCHTQAEAAEANAAAERTGREAERAAKEAAWARLRELGVEPPEV